MIPILKKIIALSIAVFLAIPMLNAQSTAGINYQAVARDNTGTVMAKANLTAVLSILDGDGTSLWEETHAVTTSPQGLFSLALGTDPSKVTHNKVESLQAIEWNKGSYTLTVQVNDGNGLQELGSNTIHAVPMALYGEDADADPDNEIQDLALNAGKLTVTRNSSATDIDLSAFVASEMAWQKSSSNVLLPTGSVGVGTPTPEGVMDIQGSLADDEAPIFQVKNDEGVPVFAVYNEGVRVYIPDDLPLTKGIKGGFAVGGYNAAKALATDEYFLQVMPGASKMSFFADDSDKGGDDTKGIKGGFAVGGYNASKTAESSFIYMDPYAVPVTYDGGFIILPLFSATAEKGNCYLGTMAGQNHEGQFNTSVGYQSGFTLDSYFTFPIQNSNAAAYNTYIGAYSGYLNYLGDRNTNLGYSAGYKSTGSGNVFIGYEAGALETTASNKLYISNSDRTDPLIKGDFSAEELDINGDLYVNGELGVNFGPYFAVDIAASPGDDIGLRVLGDIYSTGNISGLSITNRSDARIKENIEPIINALDMVRKLRGVRFNFKSDEEFEFTAPDNPRVGVIAQEVESVLPELVSEDYTGLKSVAYSNLTAVLIEAVKEQQAIIEANEKESAEREDEMMKTMKEMQQTIEGLSKKVKKLERKR